MWENQKRALDTVSKSLADGTFHTVREKGAAPPSQSGQLNLWIMAAIREELRSRNEEHLID